MEREISSDGLLAIVVATLRTHRLEAALTVLAAAVWLLGVVWHDEPPIGMPVFAGESQVDDVDATLVSALLDMRDGAWRVRADDVVRVPVHGERFVSVEHVADEVLLFPRSQLLHPAGAPFVRWSVPDWRLDALFRVVRRDGVPGLRVDEGGSAVRGWRMTAFWGNADLGSPMIVAGFNPLGWPMGYTPAGGGVLHVAVLVDDSVPGLAKIDGWRELVARDAERLAAVVATERAAADRAAWWNARSHQVSTITALASVLRVDDAVPALSELRADLDRDVTPANRGGTFYADNLAATLDGALALLAPRGEGDPDALAALLAHFSEPEAVLERFATTYADTDAMASIDALGDPDDVWRPRQATRVPDAPHTSPPTPLLILAVLALLASGGANRVRRRDFAAVAGATFLASTGTALVPHVTLGSVGLLALAGLLAHLRRRGAIAVARGVLPTLAISAVGLSLASVMTLPVVDALARAIGFVGLVWLAVGVLNPRPEVSDAPRRTSRKRDTLWASFQVLAVTLGVTALLLAVLNPGSWATQAPQPKWVLVSVGLVLGLGAGLTAYLRDRERRVQPAAMVAVTLGVASHLTALALATFVTEWTSGAKEVAAVGMIAAETLALFLILRLAMLAHTARRAVPAAEV